MTNVLSQPSQFEREKAPSENRLAFLDGIRGLAALAVVVFHAYKEVGDSIPDTLPIQIDNVLNRLLFGNATVDVFIVLSGFCLMIPLARRDTFDIPGGNHQYFIRRACRILPAYYFVYLAFTGVAIAFPALAQIPGASWTHCLPPTSATVVLTHLLMLHNFFPSWQLRIDVPLWSVATEWQIYFLFPFFLLPVLRRYGNSITISAAFAVGLALGTLGIMGARPWFLGLFALGMCAARASLRPKSDPPRAPWAIASALVAACAYALHIAMPTPRLLDTIICEDILVGIATASLLICLSSPAQGARGPFSALLTSRPVLQLGAISYSLYLCHAPVQAIVHYAGYRLGWASSESLIAQFAFGVPLALACAAATFRAFEQPWLRRRDRRTTGSPAAERTEQPAI